MHGQDRRLITGSAKDNEAFVQRSDAQPKIAIDPPHERATSKVKLRSTKRRQRAGSADVHRRADGGRRRSQGSHPAKRPPYQRASCVIWIRLPQVSFSMAMVEPVTSVGGIVNSAPRALMRS